MWGKPAGEKILYLTFDDGPHITATPFILEHLKQYNAKATFFCIGKNVLDHPDIYARIINEGHKVGNHTFNHLNAWKTDNDAYLQNVYEAAKYIDTDLFRPPYGRISRFQSKLLQETKQKNGSVMKGFKIIMWTVLSADFDIKISPERCLQNVILNTKPGSIIVFHDSTKAWDRMSFALPKVLEHFSSEGYKFETI